FLIGQLSCRFNPRIHELKKNILLPQSTKPTESVLDLLKKRLVGWMPKVELKFAALVVVVAAISYWALTAINVPLENPGAVEVRPHLAKGNDQAPRNLAVDPDKIERQWAADHQPTLLDHSADPMGQAGTENSKEQPKTIEPFVLPDDKIVID